MQDWNLGHAGMCVGRGIERVCEGCLLVAVCVHVNVDSSKFKCEYECLFTVHVHLYVSMCVGRTDYT